MCKQGWCFSINNLSKLSLLPLLIPFGCSWLLRSQTGGLLWCKFITLALLWSSWMGVKRKPELRVVFTRIFISAAILSMHGEAVVVLASVFSIPFNLAQPLLQCKLWLCPGSFLVLLLDTWRKCLCNSERVFFDVAASSILGLLNAPAFRASDLCQCHWPGELPHLQHFLLLIRKT